MVGSVLRFGPASTRPRPAGRAALPPPGRGDLSIQTMSACDAEAVAAQVVMAAGWTHQAPRRVSLQPPLILSPVPDAILGPEHPPPSLAVKHCQIAHRKPESSSLQPA